MSSDQVGRENRVCLQGDATKMWRSHEGDAYSGMAETRVRKALIAIVALAVLVRLLHFWAISGTALPKLHTVVESDMRAYWEWANRTLDGDLLGRDTYQAYTKYMQLVAPLDTWYRWWGGKEIFRTAPLYPYLVAGLLWLFGRSLLIVLLAQLLVGALQPVVMFTLTRRLFDARAGLLAAVLTALYGPFIFYQGVLLRDWLPPILEPLALLALVTATQCDRARSWLAAGAALGLALVTKETVLFFLALVGLWLVWEYRSERRRAVKIGAWLLAGLLVVLSPVVIRNAIVGAPPFALSNRAISSFVTGNAADSVPVGWAPVPATMKRVLERSDGKLLAVIRETLRTYEGNYSAFLYKQLLKLGGLVDAYEQTGEGVSFYYGLEISPVLRFTIRYAVVFPLGVAGLLLSLSAPRRHRLVHLYLAATLGALLFSMVQERYRLMLVPVLILYGAAFLVWLADAIRGRHVGRVVAALGVVLAVLLLQQVALPVLKRSMGYGKGPGWGRQFLAAARVYEAEGRLDRAVEEIVRLRARSRQDARLASLNQTAALLEGEYRIKRAKQLLEAGRRDEAAREAELAEEALGEQGGQAGGHYDLALLYLKLGDHSRARRLLRRSVELAPNPSEAEKARQLLAELGDPP
jgi:tetratricopeptide (TPR) repeat protein